MALLIDATSSPSVASMQAAGVTCISRYLAPTGLSKVIHAAEYASLRSAGMEVQLNWENYADDWRNTHGSGASDGASAVAQAKALGHPAGCAIVGSADFDMSLSTWNSGGNTYATGFANAVRSGGYVAGVYGPWDVLGWANSTGLFGVFWQAGMSTAWSGGRNASLWPGAQIRQRRTGTVGGVEVDFSDVINDDYGQAGGSIMGTSDFTSACTGSLNRGNSRDDILADLGNARDHMYSPPGVNSKNPPPAGSRLALMIAQANNADSLSFAMSQLLESVSVDYSDNPDAPGLVNIPLSVAIKEIQANVAALAAAPGATLSVTQEMLTAAVAANIPALAAELAKHINVS